jgi:type II secretory pathway pseudopilin PulG
MAGKRYGLNMMELLALLAIVALVAMVVVPELSTASSDVRIGELRGAHRRVQNAINEYAVDHDGVWPDERIAEQLTSPTSVGGAVGPAGGDRQLWPCGPYLDRIPGNPYVNSRLAGRIKLAPAERGGGNAGWYYDPASGTIRPDLAESWR